MIPEKPTNIIETQTVEGKEDDPYDIEKCARWIEMHNLDKVCLQFPDDLLPVSVEAAMRLEKRLGKKMYILADTSYGSCCVDEVAAQHVNADGIIHYGHACLNPTGRIPVFHVLPRKEISLTNLMQKFQCTFEECDTRILFFYDVAYAYKIECIKQALSGKYNNIVFSTLNCTSNVQFTDTTSTLSSTILGRNFELENGYKVEDYEAVFLGEDGKTLANLSMSVPAKKWYHFDDNAMTAIEAMNTPWLKRRRFLIEKLKDAKVVGIVVATLGIQEYLKAIVMIKNVFKEKNIKSYILSVGKINPSKLANFPEIDAFVLIGCPENEVFDSRDFLRPILLPYEVELAFNSARVLHAQYCMDFRQILPGGVNYTEFTPSTDSDISLITGELRHSNTGDLCAEKMNALAIRSSGAVAIGKAGAQFLQDRSWKGVEQRLGKDAVQPAEIGRKGLPTSYENEPVSANSHNTQT